MGKGPIDDAVSISDIPGQPEGLIAVIIDKSQNSSFMNPNQYNIK